MNLIFIDDFSEKQGLPKGYHIGHKIVECQTRGVAIQNEQEHDWHHVL